MAGEVVVKVELENLTRVEKDIYYMRTSAGNMRIHGSRIVANTVNRTKKVFRYAIQQYVYSIPLTTYDRTGNLGRGVRSREFSGGLGRGEIYMDHSIRGPNDYFYPEAVEHGLRSKPAYWGRHFWIKGKVMAIKDFESQMKPYAEEIAASLLGRKK